MLVQTSTPPLSTVKDVMCTQPIAIEPAATARQLARLLLEHGVSGVPVVDRQRRAIGVVSKTDLLQWCVKGGLGFGAGDLLLSLAEGGNGTRVEAVDLGIVADFMTNQPITIRPHQPLAEAARLMWSNHVHRLIVVDDAGRLQGILTSMDLLKAYPAAT
jgi:CBS domain-containing protein